MPAFVANRLLGHDNHLRATIVSHGDRGRTLRYALDEKFEAQIAKATRA